MPDENVRHGTVDSKSAGARHRVRLELHRSAMGFRNLGSVRLMRLGPGNIDV